MLHVDRLTSNRLLARNIGLNVAGWAVPMTLAFIAIPVLLRHLGEARFGVLSLAWALVGYFSLFDLGLGRALTQLVSDALGRGETDRVGPMVWTALWMTVPLGVLGAVVVAGLAPTLVERVLNIPAALRPESLRAFVLFAVAIPFTVQTAGLRGVLEAAQAFGRINALRVPLAVVTFLGPLAVLPFSNELPASVGVLAAGRVVLWLLHVHACRHAFPPMRRVTRPDTRHLRALLSVGGWMTVSNIVSPLMNSCDRFVVGAVLSVGVVAHYTTAYETVTRLWVITGVLLPVLFPALSLALARDRAVAVALVDRAYRATLLAAFPAALCVGAFAPEWLTVWIGRDVAVHVAPLAQGLAAAVFVNIMAQVVYTVLQAAGRADLTGKFHLLELGPYAVLLWLLLRQYGPIGVVLTWGLRTAADAAALHVAAARAVPDARRAIMHGAWLTACATPLLVAPTFVASATTRAVYVLVVLAVTLPFAVRRLVRHDERALLRRLVIRYVAPSATAARESA